MNPTVEGVDRWWRAANYLSVGQMYLRDDPLLTRPLTPDDIDLPDLDDWRGHTEELRP